MCPTSMVRHKPGGKTHVLITFQLSKFMAEPILSRSSRIDQSRSLLSEIGALGRARRSINWLLVRKLSLVPDEQVHPN